MFLGLCCVDVLIFRYWKSLEGTRGTHMTENVMNVSQPVELIFEEDEKVNFFFSH